MGRPRSSLKGRRPCYLGDNRELGLALCCVCWDHTGPDIPQYYVTKRVEARGMVSLAGRGWSDNTERVNAERGSEHRLRGNRRRRSRKSSEMDTVIPGPRTTRTSSRSLPPERRERSWSRAGSSCGQSSGAPIFGGHSEILSGRGNSDSSNRMRVGVRVRPAILHEVLQCKHTRRSGGYRPAVTVLTERSKGLHWEGVDEEYQEVASEEKSEREGEILARSTACPRMVMLRMMNGRQRYFAFDEAFDSGCPQREVYQRYDGVRTGHPSSVLTFSSGVNIRSNGGFIVVDVRPL